MKVRILKDDSKFNLKAGDIFKAERFYDPEKVVLLERESDGYDPECTIYKENIEYIFDDKYKGKE